YEQWGGAGLKQVAQILQQFGGRDDLERMLRLITLNVVLGNCDNHAKNMSFLHTGDGRISLAPAYDLLSTCLYPKPDENPWIVVGGREYASEAVDRISGMFINHKQVVD